MQLYLFQTAWSQKLISSLSWTLAHSLWLGFLFAALTAIGLLLAKKASAAYRYNITLLLFTGFVLSCCCAFFWEWNNVSIRTMTSILTADAGGEGGYLAGIQELATTFSMYFTTHSTEVAFTWFVIVSIRCLQLGASLIYHKRIEKRMVCAPDPGWTDRLTILCRSLGIRKKITLLESGILRAPAVIGHFKPVIFFPIGMLTNLTPAEAEAALLHELGHIRRNDYLVNILQNVADSMFFFNPGALWMSSIIRRERENSCDDIAISGIQNKKDLVSALIACKELSLYGSRYTTAFPGVKHQLLNRVARIVTGRNASLFPMEKAFFITGVIILSALLAITSGKTNTSGIERQTGNLLRSPNIGAAQRSAATSVIPATAVANVASVADVSKRARNRRNPLRELPVPEAKCADNNIEIPETPESPDQAMVIASITAGDNHIVFAHSASMTEHQVRVNVEMENHRMQSLIDEEEAKRDKLQAEFERQQDLIEARQAALEAEIDARDNERSEKDRRLAEKEIQRARTIKQQVIQEGNRLKKEIIEAIDIIKFR